MPTGQRPRANRRQRTRKGWGGSSSSASASTTRAAPFAAWARAPGGRLDQCHVFHIGQGRGFLDCVAGGIAGLLGNKGEGGIHRVLVETLQNPRDQTGPQHLLGFPAHGVRVERFGSAGGFLPVGEERRLRLGKAQTVQIGAGQNLFPVVERFAKPGKPCVGVQALGEGLGLVEQRNFFEQARNVGAFGIVLELHEAYLAIPDPDGQGKAVAVRQKPRRKEIAPGLEGGDRAPSRAPVSSAAPGGDQSGATENGSASGGTTPILCLSVSVTITPQRPDFCK